MSDFELICTVFELQLVIKVCYNVKCKEYIQAAADECQSLLFLTIDSVGRFFIPKNGMLVYRYFRIILNIKLGEVVMMNEFRVELYIDSGELQKTELSNLDEKDINQWKTELEERALGEYYNKKIKISNNKI